MPYSHIDPNFKPKDIPSLEFIKHNTEKSTLKEEIQIRKQKFNPEKYASQKEIEFEFSKQLFDVFAGIYLDNCSTNNNHLRYLLNLENFHVIRIKHNGRWIGGIFFIYDYPNKGEAILNWFDLNIEYANKTNPKQLIENFFEQFIPHIKQLGIRTLYVNPGSDRDSIAQQLQAYLAEKQVRKIPENDLKLDDEYKVHAYLKDNLYVLNL